MYIQDLMYIFQGNDYNYNYFALYNSIYFTNYFKFLHFDGEINMYRPNSFVANLPFSPFQLKCFKIFLSFLFKTEIR